MSNRDRLRRSLLVLAVGALYVATAKLGLALASRAAQVTAFWPPTGFALFAVLRFGRWAIPGIALGAFVANATAGEPLWVAAGVAIGNTLEAVLGAAILRRLDFDGRVGRVRDVLALVGAVLVSPLVAATLGATCLVLGGVQPASAFPGLWWIWWLGDALGGLIFAPPLLAWTDVGPMPRRRGAVVEGAGLLLFALAASAMVFMVVPPVLVTGYVVFPFLIWAALRFGPAMTATVVIAVNALAAAGTILGRGPFAGAGPEQGLVLLQIFMAVAATTGLVLGAVAAQNRQAQERAEDSEQRLLLAMTGARIVVWEWEVGDGKFDAFRKLIHPDDLPRVEAAIAKAIETRTPYEADMRIRGEDGEVHWVDARGQVVEGEGGRAVRMIGVAIDVSRQKQLEEELRMQALRKDEFLAMLGHELRNPLAPIVHAAELLGRKDPGLVERARDIIRRQADHLTRLVGDLLDVSRITRGTVKLERRVVALRDVVGPAVETWRHLISQRRQQLSIDLPDKPVWLDVDPTRFTQVISNLLHNAVKFTAEGGRITIIAKERDGTLELRIRDSGEGMAPEVLAHVFDVFVQGPPPLDRPYGGLGLGLTLVRRLVEVHGGSVEAASEGLGRGSELTVRIATTAPPAKIEDGGLKPAAPRDSSTRRVLVVEDHADAREALTMLLEESGHEVRTAADGPTAIGEAQQFRPEVVLLDIGLPGIDGYAVARQLRTLPECGDALIVAVTGYGQAEDRALSREAGFDDHLLKPVEPARLLELLQPRAS